MFSVCGELIFNETLAYSISQLSYPVRYMYKIGISTVLFINCSPLPQYSPLIDNDNFAYVHHMLVYICGGLNETQVNDSGPCQGGVGESLSECRFGEIMGAWAVGGEVSKLATLNIELV